MMFSNYGLKFGATSFNLSLILKSENSNYNNFTFERKNKIDRENGLIGLIRLLPPYPFIIVFDLAKQTRVSMEYNLEVRNILS